jgi:hypothetical protein
VKHCGPVPPHFTLRKIAIRRRRFISGNPSIDSCFSIELGATLCERSASVVASLGAFSRGRGEILEGLEKCGPHELGVHNPQQAWSAPIPIHSQSIGEGSGPFLRGTGVRKKEGALAPAPLTANLPERGFRRIVCLSRTLRRVTTSHWQNLYTLAWD